MAAAVVSPDLPWFEGLDQAAEFHQMSSANQSGEDHMLHFGAGYDPIIAGYGENALGLGDATAGYGNATAGFGDAALGYRDFAAGFGGAAAGYASATLGAQSLHQPPQYRAQAHNITRGGFRFNAGAAPFAVPGAAGLNPDAKPFAAPGAPAAGNSVPGAALNANAKPFSIPSPNGGVFKFNAEAQPFSVPGSGAGVKLNAHAQPFQPPTSQATVTPPTSFNFNANAKPFEVVAVARVAPPAQGVGSKQVAAGARAQGPATDATQALMLPGVHTRDVEEVRRSPNTLELLERQFASDPPQETSESPAALAAMNFIKRYQDNAAEPKGKPKNVPKNVPKPIVTSPPLSRQSSEIAESYQSPYGRPQSTRSAMGQHRGSPAAGPQPAGPQMLTPSASLLSPTTLALRSLADFTGPASQDRLPSPAAAAALKFIRRNVEVLPEAVPQLRGLGPAKRASSPCARSASQTTASTVIKSPGSTTQKSPVLSPSAHAPPPPLRR